MPNYSPDALERRRASSAEWWRVNGAPYREKNRAKIRAASKKHASANREELNARSAKWRSENADRQREFEIAYRRENPDKRKLACAKYRADNVDKERSYRVKWAAANKDKLAARSAARRALKLKATPTWVNWEEIAAFYADAQAKTAATGSPYHVDHIVPLKSKIVCGLHCPANLQVLPGLDNLSKGNRIWPDMP